MKNHILNLPHEGFIEYTFTVGFNHGMSNHTLILTRNSSREGLMHHSMRRAIDEASSKAYVRLV